MATATVGDLRCAVCETEFDELNAFFEHDCDADDGGAFAVADD